MKERAYIPSWSDIVERPGWYRHCTPIELVGEDGVSIMTIQPESIKDITAEVIYGATVLLIETHDTTYQVERHDISTPKWDALATSILKWYSVGDPDWLYHIDANGRHPRRIVSAAIRIGDYVIPGPRYGSPIMSTLSRALYPDIHDFILASEKAYVEGFIDQYDTFWSNVDALSIAINAKQPLYITDDTTVLHSENIY